MQERPMKRYAGLMGFGFMLMWGSATVAWADFVNSEAILLKALGWIAFLAITGTGISIMFYINDLEAERKKLNERYDALHDETLFYKEQNSVLLNRIESENSARD